MKNEIKITDYVHFKEELPFYDMVTSFMVALAGSPSIFNKENISNFSPDQYISVQGILVQGRHFRPMEVFQLAQDNKISQEKFLKSCCNMLANTAYEAVKDKNDKSPEFEFFRHIRNASSHRNLFNFIEKEPKLPASWRGTTIDHNLKGKSNPLYNKECFGVFIGIADLIDLLKDIEAKTI